MRTFDLYSWTWDWHLKRVMWGSLVGLSPQPLALMLIVVKTKNPHWNWAQNHGYYSVLY